jgi:hypothetical protein
MIACRQPGGLVYHKSSSSDARYFLFEKLKLLNYITDIYDSDNPIKAG